MLAWVLISGDWGVVDCRDIERDRIGHDHVRRSARGQRKRGREELDQSARGRHGDVAYGGFGKFLEGVLLVVRDISRPARI